MLIRQWWLPDSDNVSFLDPIVIKISFKKRSFFIIFIKVIINYTSTKNAPFFVGFPVAKIIQLFITMFA